MGTYAVVVVVVVAVSHGIVIALCANVLRVPNLAHVNIINIANPIHILIIDLHFSCRHTWRQ